MHAINIGSIHNRTGISRDAAMSRDMSEAAQESIDGTDAADFVEYRREEQQGKPPVATMPPPPRSDQAPSPVLLDKLGERLAFERSGVRLYETLVLKQAAGGDFTGGPTREDLEQLCADERKHFEMLEEIIVARGGDPTGVTPGANLVAVETRGIAATILDARTTLAEGLHALLVAELADNAGWEQLIELMQELGDTTDVERFEAALEEEQDHLARVRGWLSADLRQQVAMAEPPSRR